MIDKNRLTAMTDAIIAVAATVMVLRLNIPDMVSLAAAKAQFPTLLAYIISFVQIFLVWHEHHDTFHKVDAVNHRVFLLNTVWLFFVTLLPFVTGIVGQVPNHKPTVLLYIALLTVIQLLMALLENRMEAYTGTKILDRAIIHRLRGITLIGYAAIALITLATPKISMPLILLVSVVNIVLICRYDRKGTES